MKKQILLRGGIGIPIGITISYLFTIVGSLCWGTGAYSPCVPELTAAVGSEIYAVLLQMVLSAVLGFVCAAASVVWDIERWGIAVQTGVYFLILSVIMLPIAYVLRWMEHSVSGCLIYLGIFVALFVLIWLFSYLIGKYNVKKMNSRLNK